MFPASQPRQPALTHKFLVLLGHMTMGFSKVSGLSQDTTPEYFREGGYENPRPLASAHRHPQTLVFEHGMGILPDFERQALLLDVPLAGTIIIQGLDRMIGFTCLMPARWEIGDLDAAKSGVLIHRLEIIHDGLSYVD